MRLTSLPAVSASRKKRAVGTLAMMGAFLLTLTGCASEVPEPKLPQETEVAVSYPVPAGCPTAEDLGEAFIQNSEWVEAINVDLLQSEVSTPLLEGGCGYAVREARTVEDSERTYRRVLVFYFRLGEAGKVSEQQIAEWAQRAGGAPRPERDPVTDEPTGEFSDSALDLPTDFSGWTGADVIWVDGEQSWIFFDRDDGSSVIPEYTSRGTAKVDFFLDGDRVNAIAAQGVDGSSGVALDPTLALSQGLAASFSTSIAVSNEEGYTGTVEVSARLQPWTSDITDVPPGQFEAFAKASAEVTYTNTTSGRRSLLPTARVWVLYPFNSAGCEPSSGVSVEGDIWSDSTFCRVSLGHTYDLSLEPDAVQTVDAERTPLQLGPLDENSDALTVLNTPITAYLVFDGARPIGDANVWVGETGCHVRTETGGKWVSVMDGWPDVLCK